MQLFTIIFEDLDAALDTYVNAAIGSATGYVSGPIATIGIIAFILMGVMLLQGRAEIPIAQFVRASVTLSLVFALAGSAGNYNTYLADHLRDLPDELMATFAVGGAMGDEDSVGQVLDHVAESSMDGISAIWAAGGFNNPGAYFMAVVLFVILLIFGVAAVIALATAKIGLSLVVAIGPLMILGLLVRATQEYFTKWISYALQFSILALFVGGIAGIANTIVDTYIAALAESPDTVDMVALMGPSLILLLLAKIFAELPSMASSVAGGIGLSVGNTAWNGVQRAIHHAGGKHMAAWSSAANWRRQQRMESRQQALADAPGNAWRRISSLGNRNKMAQGRGTTGRSNEADAARAIEARRERMKQMGI